MKILLIECSEDDGHYLNMIDFEYFNQMSDNCQGDLTVKDEYIFLCFNFPKKNQERKIQNHIFKDEHLSYNKNILNIFLLKHKYLTFSLYWFSYYTQIITHKEHKY